MTLPQILSVAVLGAMMLLFIWGKFRYDLVAILALLAALAVGIVKPKEAFSGFSDDIVIIVGSALVISGAVQRSGVIESAMLVLQRRVTRIRSQLLLLCASVGFASALVKNIGALAMMMPVAFQMSKRSNTAPAVLLMPLSVAAGAGVGALLRPPLPAPPPPPRPWAGRAGGRGPGGRGGWGRGGGPGAD